MATETESDYSGLVMGLVLVLFLAVGLISWAAAGTSNSSVNPTITVPPTTPCTAVANSYSTLNNTLQSYAFGTATIEEVNAARAEFAAVVAHELPSLAPNVKEALGPVQDELQATQDVIRWGPCGTSPVFLSIPAWQSRQATLPLWDACENLMSSFCFPKSVQWTSPLSSWNHATFFSSGLSFSLSSSSWQFMQKAFAGMPARASFSAPSWQSAQATPRTVWASWLKGRGGGGAGG